MSVATVAGIQAGRSPVISVNLLGGLHVVVDGRVREVPQGCRRLVAYVALHGGSRERREVAGALWPSGHDVRATGNLRSALWRLRNQGPDVLEASHRLVRLRAGTLVDANLVSAWAVRMCAAPEQARPDEDESPGVPWERCLRGLLPGWEHDWVLGERERIRQRVLHAMEALARRKVAAGEPASAVPIASALLAAEPLRESACRALVAALLRDGRADEAHRAYAEFAAVAMPELGPVAGRTVRDLLLRHGSGPVAAGAAW